MTIKEITDQRNEELDTLVTLTPTTTTNSKDKLRYVILLKWGTTEYVWIFATRDTSHVAMYKAYQSKQQGLYSPQGGGFYSIGESNDKDDSRERLYLSEKSMSYGLSTELLNLTLPLLYKQLPQYQIGTNYSISKEVRFLLWEFHKKFTPEKLIELDKTFDLWY